MLLHTKQKSPIGRIKRKKLKTCTNKNNNRDTGISQHGKNNLKIE